MKVHFVEPPPKLRIGGLDAAIRSLESALQSQGVSVAAGVAEDAAPGDVVHFHGLWLPFHARISSEVRRRGVPSIVSPHGMLEAWAWRHKWWKKWPYFWLVEKRHLRRATCLLATAPQEEQRIRSFLPGKDVRTVPLGFTADARPEYQGARAKLDWSPDETVLLFLSRLHQKKGLDLLLKALANTQFPALTRLIVVGGGKASYVDSVRVLAESMQSKLPKVEWIGEVWGDGRWPYFQGADLFCLPSHSENFGLAVLEASQVGTPVLTTTTTPWADWLPRGRVFIAEPTVSSIEGQLREFFLHPKVTEEERAEFTRNVESEFAWTALAPRYIDLYREVSSTHP